MDRRDFLRLSAAGILTAGLSPVESAAATVRKHGKAGDKYSMVVFGDLHYDTAPDTVYHEGYSDPNPARDAAHRKEFVRNAEMWSDRLPRLLKRGACLADDSTRIFYQTGDMIQGDTAGIDNHIRMLDDAFKIVKEAAGPLPLVTVAGNHDMRAKSDDEAREAYLKFMPEKMSKELGKKVTGNDFAFSIGQDAYIVIDFNNPDDETVAELFKKAAGARYTFVLCHAPVFPYDSEKYFKWYYHGKTKEARDRMLQVMAEHNAIVLCGHTHTTELLDWENENGRISQMTMNSVWRNDATGVYTVSAHGAEEYGRLRERNAAKNGKSVPESDTAVFDEFRPGIRQYSRSITAGSYKINVSDSGVTVDFYAGDDVRPSGHFILR